jgi:hypothetical protein
MAYQPNRAEFVELYAMYTFGFRPARLELVASTQSQIFGSADALALSCMPSVRDDDLHLSKLDFVTTLVLNREERIGLRVIIQALSLL